MRAAIIGHYARWRHLPKSRRSSFSYTATFSMMYEARFEPIFAA